MRESLLAPVLRFGTMVVCSAVMVTATTRFASAGLFSRPPAQVAFESDQRCQIGLHRAYETAAEAHKTPGGRQAWDSDLAKAQESCKKAVDLQPNQAWYLHDLATAYLLGGNGLRPSELHSAGIRTMVAAVNLAYSNADFHTVAAGCNFLIMFHLAGDAKCSAKLRQKADEVIALTSRSLPTPDYDAEREEMQRQSLEVLRMNEDYERYKAGR